MSFEEKNGKYSLKYQKFLEIFAIYGTRQGPEKTTPRSKSYVRVPP